MKGAGMLVTSLMGIDYGFWYPIGYQHYVELYFFYFFIATHKTYLHTYITDDTYNE